MRSWFLSEKAMHKTHIIKEIQRTSELNGGTPLGRQRFLNETGIRESDWIGKYWTKWSDAVREAGYEPNVMQGAFDDDWVIEKLATLVRELDHYPVVAEMNMKRRSDGEFPNQKVFQRIGRKGEVAASLIAWCTKTTGWDDVQTIGVRSCFADYFRAFLPHGI